MAIYISSGEITSRNVLSDSNMYICSGGTAHFTSVYRTGKLYVSNGGWANYTSVYSSGNVYVSSGGKANFSYVSSGGNLHISSGGTAFLPTVYRSGNLYVNFGMISSAVVKSGGEVYISGGTAKYTVLSGGRLRVSHGGSALNTSVNQDGDLFVYQGGVATSTNLFGYMCVNGGVANSITINNSGSLYVSDGMALNVNWTPFAGTLTCQAGAIITFADDPQGVFLGYYSGSKNTLLSSALTMSDTALELCSMYVMNHGTAYDVDVQNGGTMYVFSGGMAYRTKVSGTYGGIYLKVLSGGMADSVTVGKEGSLAVGSGGTALNIVWTPGVGTVTYTTGATVTFASDYQGVYVGRNGNLIGHDTVISGRSLVSQYSDGCESMYVMNGGIATSTSLSYNGCAMHVWSGGTAISTTLRRGTLCISSGGVMESTDINSGALYVLDDAVANSTVVKSGVVYIARGGVANVATVSDNGSMNVSYGGVINSAAVSSDGKLNVQYDGVVNTAVVSNRGVAIINGSMTGATSVKSGGSMVLDGGKLTGRLSIESGAVVSALNCGTINFDITDTAPGDPASVSGLSRIKGAPVYTLTVSNDPVVMGNYNLATGAAGFNQKITVVNTAGEKFGELSVDGAYVGLENPMIKRGLLLDNGNLSLGIDKFKEVLSAQALNIDGETVNSSDRAARWTGNTAASGTIHLVTSDFGGSAWFHLDGADLSENIIYGAYGNFAGAINITAQSGTIRNLAAGAAAEGSVGAVNLILGSATLAGVGYAGGFGNVTGKTATVISGASLVKDFYAGALANYAKTGTVTSCGDISLDISAGTFGGNIFGAAAVKAGTHETTAGDSPLHSAGAVSVTVTGGTNIKGEEACLFAGGYATGHDTAKLMPVYTVDSVTITVSGGEWGESGNGRGIFGGAYASDNTDAGDNGVHARVGDVSISISGGNFGNVFGGGWAQKNAKSSVGDVNISISGGTVVNVSGCGNHSLSGGSTVTGDVTITVSGGTISGDIYAKGQNASDSVNSAAVIFTGTNSFSCGVYGYSYSSQTTDNDATLSFCDYSGIFSGTIGGFDGITFDGSTAMTLDNAAAELSNFAWNFDVSARADDLADTAVLVWNNADFSGDTITLNLATGSTAEWTLVDAAATTAYGEFEVLIDGISQGSLELGDQLSAGEFTGWGFELEDTVLKFKQLA